MSNISNNKLIVKNTLFLYVRLFFTIIVTLYTSRVILEQLGVSDFGIYNVVAGTVSMFLFFTSSLASAISRFLTFEIGNNNLDRLKRIFSTSINILLVVSIVVFILSETLGLWFLNNKLNIPSERMYAANWVFQCSIITFVMNLLSVPYNAVIIAHEKMAVFAYISILEVVLKLILVLILSISCFDKLIIYAVLLGLISILIRFVYSVYCVLNFKECKYKFVYDKELLRNMSAFAGWNMMGTGAYLLNTQGVNIATNIFFNVTINAARGVAGQVDSIIKQFVTNFTTALNPQIIKSYASGDKKYMFELICKGSKYSYFLMLVFSVPFILETDKILSLWLNNVPSDCSLFVKLILVSSMVDILGNTMANAAWATGKIKSYYLLIGGVGSLVFPISYVLFMFGFQPESAYYVFIFIYVILVYLKLYIIKGLLSFPINKYVKEVLLRIFPVTAISFFLSYIVYSVMDDTLIRLLVILLVSFLSILLGVFLFGIDKKERSFVLQYIERKFK